MAAFVGNIKHTHMSTTAAIRWFKTTFHQELRDSVSGTPYDVDLLCAIAYQETGYIWSGITASHSHARIFELCVGDTLDAPNRSAFPKTRQALENAANGKAMFAIARAALEDVATVNKSYAQVAKNKNKFCHGFGIFQYDLQFLKTDASWFLQRKWTSFAECRAHVISELKAAQKRQGWAAKTTLTDTEKVHVCIAYNRGVSDLKKGFKQGHQDDNGRYYGENIHEYFTIAKNIPPPSPQNLPPPATPSVVTLPPPTAVEVVKALFQVDVLSDSTLNVRKTPEIPKTKPQSNVIAKLPAGHMVQIVSGKTSTTFCEIETSLNGAHITGFAWRKHLKAAPAGSDIEVSTPEPEPPQSGIIAAHLQPKPGTVIARSNIAGALSLNETGMPLRTGDTAEKRCTELAAIIAWLAVDKTPHKRYQPRTGLTFCNIYAHDYCTCAGVYLPRVWWTPGAIEKLAQGQQVEPLYEKTVDEQRANDLYRWLRDFGLRFGWRQTGTLTKLQDAANLGGVGIIVARRKQDGRSGHIVAVAPETATQRAKRDASGNVTHPLQSQAGSRNFRYDTGTKNWWVGEQFAESAFWIHA